MANSNNLLDITPLLDGQVREIAFDTALSPDMELADFDGDMEIKGKVINMSGYIELRCSTRYSYRAVCARCLKPLNRKLELNLTFPVTETPEEEGDGEGITAVNGQIDLYAVCRDGFVLNQPLRELCSEDCKGLCPVCGTDLNKSQCSCSKQVDPRLEKLADFFKD